MSGDERRGSQPQQVELVGPPAELVEIVDSPSAGASRINPGAEVLDVQIPDARDVRAVERLARQAHQPQVVGAPQEAHQIVGSLAMLAVQIACHH